MAGADDDRLIQELYEAVQKLNQRCLALNARLRAVERREEERREFWTRVFLALLVVAIGSVFWLGGFVSDMKHAARADARAEALEKELREHERGAADARAAPK